MSLGGFLKGLFGGGKGGAGRGGDEPARGEPVAYKDYQIVPAPMRQGGQFLTSGFIAKDFPDGRKEHRFVRADTHGSAEDAAAFAVQKGRQIIDEQGDRIFRDS
jgi:hypothetical protein